MSYGSEMWPSIQVIVFKRNCFFLFFQNLDQSWLFAWAVLCSYVQVHVSVENEKKKNGNGITKMKISFLYICNSDKAKLWLDTVTCICNLVSFVISNCFVCFVFLIKHNYLKKSLYNSNLQKNVKLVVTHWHRVCRSGTSWWRWLSFATPCC